ncbi:MAG: hypothetical protein EO766_12110 [Hydrotalea sp. AMD]|uniref:thermonuclease family protein n=1 Tax=Hydrotalea sp. AMD TaxID=2501297 RepID=UPI0010282965|nr:thermonuclease family protein [Hydrotalea sp. AMD]RWZ87262.1 MAG: hypothetical protein EO766_12110 [Hydrotalea sp. AMD]
MNKMLTGVLLTLMWIANSQADHNQCTVTRVIDGDTIIANCAENRALHVKLTKIDSYESKRNNRAYKQAYNEKISVDEVVARGKKAAQISTELLTNQVVDITVDNKAPKDRYGRTLGEVMLNGVSVNDKLLAEHPDVFLKY